MIESVPALLHEDLRARHAEPQRHYHDWTHVAALLAHFKALERRIEDREAVLYAILFHDAVYDPMAKDNERQSAALLMESTPTIAPKSLALAHRMILATEGHRMPTDLATGPAGDCAHFLDMDLAILGASEERFDIYEGQIRREYAHVPDEAFRTGRAKVLRGFLERERLYFSEWGFNRFEDRARANCRRSIEALERQP
ncbi:MAG: HD domain-containing protein [Erythrobacter sp.]